MMDDYVTRAEFEELKQMLLCRGDGQTIEVDHTPGGQLIRSNSIVTADVDTSPSSYITVTYDDIAGTYTIDVDNVPYTDISYASAGYQQQFASDPNDYLSDTFVFNKPPGATTLYLGIGKNRTSTINTTAKLYWYNTTITAYDSNTANAYWNATQSILFAEISLTDTGDYTILNEVKSNREVIISNQQPQAYARIDTSTRRLTIYNYINPTTGNTVIDGNPLTYSEPINTSIILGWNYGNPRPTLDLLSIGNVYDQKFNLGSIEIDSNNYVKAFTFLPYNLRYMHSAFGYTGTHSVDRNGGAGSTLIEITNGIITNLTEL